MSEEAKKIASIIPEITAALLLFSNIKSYFYYINFGINIYYYISASDVISNLIPFMLGLFLFTLIVPGSFILLAFKDISDYYILHKFKDFSLSLNSEGNTLDKYRELQRNRKHWLDINNDRLDGFGNGMRFIRNIEMWLSSNLLTLVLAYVLAIFLTIPINRLDLNYIFLASTFKSVPLVIISLFFIGFFALRKQYFAKEISWISLIVFTIFVINDIDTSTVKLGKPLHMSHKSVEVYGENGLLYSPDSLSYVGETQNFLFLYNPYDYTSRAINKAEFVKEIKFKCNR